MKHVKIAILILVGVGAVAFQDWYNRRNTVVYTDRNGEQTTDVTRVSGSAKFKVVGPGSIPAAAEALHQEGRKLSSQGKYDLAIERFRKASEIAPHWAYPIYDLAFTLLLQGKTADALAEYKRVDSLEPDGFFTTKTAVGALEKEVSGKIPTGTYLKYVMLEDLPSAKVRCETAKALWEQVPDFAPALKEYALGTDNDAERLALIEKALKMDLDPETRGILMLNRASSLNAAGRKEEARQILLTLKDSKTETLFTRTSAGEVLKVIDAKAAKP